MFKRLNFCSLMTNFAAGNIKIKESVMIVIPIKEGENIERALKKFKRKFEKTGTMRELRSRQAFTKPSVVRREQVKKAAYIEQLQRESE